MDLNAGHVDYSRRGTEASCPGQRRERSVFDWEDKCCSTALALD